MKRIISIFLCAIMLVSAAMVSVSAADALTGHYALGDYGQKIYNSAKVQNPPVLDGVVENGEYAMLCSSSLANVASWATDANGNVLVVDSVGNAVGVEIYSSYDENKIYFAIVLENASGKAHKYGKLIMMLGDGDDVSVHDDSTVKYANGNVSVSSPNFFSADCKVTAKGERLTYELAVDRGTLAARESYLLRMLVYMYDDSATSADKVSGSCNFCFHSPALQAAGYNSGSPNRFPHVLMLGSESVSGGSGEGGSDDTSSGTPEYSDSYNGGHNLVDYGQKQYYVGDGTDATTVDGVVSAGEYPLCIEGMTLADNKAGSDAFFVAGHTDSLESMDIYANHDDNFFYFAVKMKDSAPKSNDFFYFNLGVYEETHRYLEIYMPFYGGGKSIEIWPFENGASGGRGSNMASTLLGSSKMTYADGYVTYEISLKRDFLESYAGSKIDKLYVTGHLLGIDDETGGRGPAVWFGFRSDSLKAGGTHAPRTSNYYPHVFFYGDKADYESFFADVCGAEFSACEHAAFGYVNYDAGSHVEICKACGYMKESEAHSFDEGAVTKPATDTATGVKTYNCTVCALTRQEELAIIAGAHDFSIPLRKDDESHRSLCACGEELIEAHEWSFKEHFLNADGSLLFELYKCAGCGATKQEKAESTDNADGREKLLSVEIIWTRTILDFSAGNELVNDITLKNLSGVGIELTFAWNGEGVGGELSADRGVIDAGEMSFVSLKATVGDSDDKREGSVIISLKALAREPDVTLEGEAIDTSRFVYEHVLILGLDGIGNFRLKTDTPNIDAIFGENAITDIAITSLPSGTGPCWSSMFTGVLPSVLGLSSNPDATTPAVNATYAAAQKKFPSVFSMTRESYPDAEIVSISSWNQMNDYVIGNDDGTVKINTSGSDYAVRDKTLEYIESGDMPELMFVHFDSADALGHVNGYETTIYLSAITSLDAYVGEIYAALEENGLLDTTLIILATDHGGTGKTHGGDSEAEMTITLGFCGKAVLPVKQFDMTIRDVAPVIAHALDLGESEKWTDVSVPEYLFADTVK